MDEKYLSSTDSHTILLYTYKIALTPEAAAAAAAATLLDSKTNASAELLAAPSMLVAGSLVVDTTSQLFSPACSF